MFRAWGGRKRSLFVYATLGASVRLALSAPGPGLARPAHGRAGRRRWPPGGTLRAPRRSLTAPLPPFSHRGGQRVLTGRALHSLYVRARCKRCLVLSIYDDSQLLRRSALENRAARDTYSSGEQCVFRTEETPCWVCRRVTRDDVRYRRLAYYDRQAARHAFPAMPRPAGPPWLRSPRARCEDGRRGRLAAAAETERFGRWRSGLRGRTLHRAVRAVRH